MFRTILPAALLALGTAAAEAQQGLIFLDAPVLTPLTPVEPEVTYLTLDPITTPIVPQAMLRGDREFGGNGPDLTVRVRLFPGRGGRAIFAEVTFRAAETGGDFSTTEITETHLVWQWDPSMGARFVQSIDAPVFEHTVRSEPTCGTCAGHVFDGAVPTSMTGGPYGVINHISMIGDTMGSDVSTDRDPRGDTHVRSIAFRPFLVTWSDHLGG
ncbi:hypothetical protein HKCCE2091_17575 [Rhodobacterales bacterium HKCCE2091]|nr:hypothetical protein [Rhodobacterales bacterium HKCCE2091]